MVASLNIEEEKSTVKPLLIFGIALGFALLCFFIFSVVSLALVHFFVCGATGSNCCVFEHNRISDSGFIYSFFQAYANWFMVFKQSIIVGNFNLLLMLPILVQVLSLVLLGFLLLRSSYSFSLWFVLRNHFANLQDVEKMGLKGGTLMVLGRLGDNLLGISRSASVLCVGETGCGKTSTLAVPSILRSDNMSVIAIDNTGTLARHTSGYRSKVSDIFYFNWDVTDDDDKGIVYPRWNPLSVDNIPEKMEDKIEYLRFLATYLISDEKGVDTDNYWKWLSSGTLLSLIYFLMTKCKQAIANDYFLGKIIEGSRLTNDDKDILLSYYALMPDVYSQKGIKAIQKEKISLDEYIPIGSWEGLPVSWQGHDLCFGMVADWLLQNYLANKDNNGNGDWRQWLETLLLEAEVFNYGNVAIKGIKQFLYLSKLQRQLVFAQILKPLKVFLNQNVREKTSGNDFKMSDWAGKYDEEAKKVRPITIYAAANTKTTKFINRMFVDVLLNYGVLKPNNRNKLPVLMV
ncbi:MAG: type IV secretory system conjugative DNA transfer family protein, partial [Alphaproteobacteria bacterium]|nr:type IV secretory system conjugative DNA transfer family protein [Alphaproteobacteria bacterium]